MCGFVGSIGTSDASARLLLGLQAIQHRGQDSAGIATMNGHGIHLRKGMGMIRDAVG